MTENRPPRFLNDPPHPGFVTGREGLLANIHSALESGEAVALVRGIGGIGKTTAALAYLHDTAYSNCYAHLLWIEINSSLPEAFARQRDVQERLGIRAETDDLLRQNNLEGVVLALLEALRRLPGPKLLVIDNANDRDEIRHWKKILLHSGCRLLLTSRAEIPNVADLPVPELEPLPAATLFWHHYRPGEPLPVAGPAVSELPLLLDDIAGHTLLIEMFGKIGRQAGQDIAGLRRQAAEGFVFSKKLQRSVPTGPHTERKGLDEATLEDLVLFLFRGIAPGMSAREIELLRQVAVLPPGAHPPVLLTRIFQLPEADETAFFETLDSLHRRGVPLKKDGNYQLHRLLRAVALRELQPDAENCAALLAGVTELLSIDQYKDNPVDKFPFVGYGEAVLEALVEKEIPDIRLLQNELAIVYRNLGEYMRARDLLETALVTAVKNFGAGDPSVAVSQSNLGNVYYSMGDYVRARDLLETALATDLKNFGPGDPSVAAHQSNLGNVYRNMGNYVRARDLLETALATGLNNFGPDHPSVAAYQSNLGNVYRNMGNYVRARDLLETALATDLKNFGPDHPSVAVSQSNLGNVYRNMGDCVRARDLLETALATGLKNFGTAHPSVAIRQSNLANVYRDMGDYVLARDLLETALATDLKNFGTDHPSVAVSQSNLAKVYDSMGEYVRARDLLEAALANDLKNLGEEHPYTKMDRKSLADLLEKMNGPANED
ncbi:MAG: tetratricopeptide repeat protein [Saprospiraceae bacterium]|nr:tetratricopeptide repeat protein [Saprospiraceae bacterium]